MGINIKHTPIILGIPMGLLSTSYNLDEEVSECIEETNGEQGIFDEECEHDFVLDHTDVEEVYGWDDIVDGIFICSKCGEERCERIQNCN